MWPVKTVSSLPLGLLWIFRCPELIILFVHILWQVEMWFVIRTVLITASSFISTRIYNIFKTYCITSVTLSTKYHYFIIFSFLILNNVYQVSMYLSKFKKTPHKLNICSEKCSTINYTHLIHNVCQILSAFTNQLQSLYLHIHCLHRPHTNS
jgi:hypothetical protein